MSSIRLGPCRARRLPCRLRTCRGRCRPLPGCLAFTPPRTEPDTIQIAPPKLNSTIEVRSRPDKQSPDERLPSPRGAEGAAPCLPAVAEDGGSGDHCPNQLVQDPLFTGTGRACGKEKSGVLSQLFMENIFWRVFSGLGTLEPKGLRRVKVDN